MRFSTTLLAGLFTTVLASASEYQAQQRFECLTGCAMEAGLRTWFQYDQGQANPSVLESIELFCSPDSFLADTFIVQSNICLARNCNITMTELPAISEALCGLFKELTNVMKPQNTMNSTFTATTIPTNTPTEDNKNVTIPITETPIPKPAEDSCVNGAYQCVDSGKSDKYTICSNGRILAQVCPAGTVCKTVQDSIVCERA
ncbi:hypothetical protein K7432_009997 [Basidiobolus ranarum]|uniref:Carbohydrate-binding module family 19 domain-containing protein n=1 Tax=Basidiobolus ranarum TaxID=34480 RepID=A0ABR2VW76_9FUNG